MNSLYCWQIILLADNEERTIMASKEKNKRVLSEHTVEIVSDSGEGAQKLVFPLHRFQQEWEMDSGP